MIMGGGGPEKKGPGLGGWGSGKNGTRFEGEGVWKKLNKV